MADQIQLSMPPVFRRALNHVEAMSASDFETFVKTLSGLSPALRTTKVGESLGKALPALTASDLAGVIEFAVSTRSLLASFETDLDTLTEAVIRATFAADRQTQDESRGAVLRPRVNELLSTDFIAKREKSESLARDFSGSLAGSRCLVDIRPVFPTNGQADQLGGAVIIGTLRLDVDGAGESPIYLRVSSTELERLSATALRALEKMQTLTSFLSASNLADLTPESE